jgi:predicted DNA-binding protein
VETLRTPQRGPRRLGNLSVETGRVETLRTPQRGPRRLGNLSVETGRVETLRTRLALEGER